MPTQTIPLDYSSTQTVIYNNSIYPERVKLDGVTIWEILRTATVTGYDGGPAPSVDGGWFGDGGHNTFNKTFGNITLNLLEPSILSINKLGIKVEWRGQGKSDDKGKINWITLSFTTNGDSIPSFTTTLDTSYSHSWMTWGDTLDVNIPSNVSALTINAVVDMSFNDHNNGGGEFKLTVDQIN